MQQVLKFVLPRNIKNKRKIKLFNSVTLIIWRFLINDISLPLLLLVSCHLRSGTNHCLQGEGLCLCKWSPVANAFDQRRYLLHLYPGGYWIERRSQGCCYKQQLICVLWKDWRQVCWPTLLGIASFFPSCFVQCFQRSRWQIQYLQLACIPFLGNNIMICINIKTILLDSKWPN